MQKEIKKIVLIEDEDLVRNAYAIVLTRAGYEVSQARDGLDGLYLIKKTKPNLILLDIKLPVVNGFEVLQKIKEDQDLSAIPVLVLSNLGQDTDIQKGLELGAVAYLVKMNNNMNEVLEKVKLYIK